MTKIAPGHGGNYGKEVILDLHNCDSSMFTRKELRRYFKELCEKIDMTRAKLVFWDDHGVPEEERQTELHTVGTSAIQFILTSNVTIHTLDLLGSVYVNIFSCKDFKANDAAYFTEQFFKGKIVKRTTLVRK